MLLNVSGIVPALKTAISPVGLRVTEDDNTDTDSDLETE